MPQSRCQPNINYWSSLLIAGMLASCQEVRQDVTPLSIVTPSVPAARQCECASGSQVACNSLAASFVSGTATCRPDCGGYDVSACTNNQTANGFVNEFVIPKQRDPQRWANAICSDGNPYAFRVSLSPTGSKNWVVYLNGGGRCDGLYHPCTDRDPALFVPVSSQDRKLINANNSIVKILNRDSTINPTFWDANFVSAAYCTNDMWMGTRTTPLQLQVGPSTQPSVAPIYFSGRNNVKAILDTVIRSYGLNDLDPAVRVLFFGESAGGWGVQFNADLLKPRIPHIIADRRLWVASEAAWALSSWNDPIFDLQYSVGGSGLTQQQYSEWLTQQYQAEFGPDCIASAVAAGLTSTACFAGTLTYQTMIANNYRVFIEQNRLDAVPMAEQELPIDSPTLTSHEQDARALWLQKENADFAQIKWLWAPADPVKTRINGTAQANFHGIFDHDRWSQLPPSNIRANTCGTSIAITYRDMLTHFWNASKENDSGERYCFDGDWVL